MIPVPTESSGRAGRVLAASGTAFLGSLYVLELSLFLAAIALYKGVGKPFTVFLGSRPGMVLIAAILAALGALAFIVHQVRFRGLSKDRGFTVLLIVNLFSLILMFATAEIAIRLLTRKTPAGEVFANAPLLPRSWGAVVAKNREVLKKAARTNTFLVYDKDLGWSSGSNRQSTDYNREFQNRYLAQLKVAQPPIRESHDEAIYASSVEGIRSPRAGMAMVATKAKHRIALVGDSYTFGLEVPYEGTWGHKLEAVLGADYQVLNFGVDGYGVDQAYLRYKRDVSPLRPDIVILAVAGDDPRRSMCVYAFLCFPGSEIPFAKPRFVIRSGELTLVNMPLPAPDSIFARHSIFDLPFIEHDCSFDAAEWRSTFLHHSYALRLVFSRLRRWPIPGPTVTIAVNTEIVHAFRRAALANGSQPVVLYFPTRASAGPESSNAHSIARDILERAGIPYVDMTECIMQVPAASRFVVLHYSSLTNEAIAQCLAPIVASATRE